MISHRTSVLLLIVLINGFVFHYHCYASSSEAPTHAAGGATHAPATKGVAANEALSRLTYGNKRFVEENRLYPNQNAARREETTAGQKPFVSILSCADSRVPVEEIFDAGIGDLFVMRVAGNIADESQIGTLEYGVGHLGTNLIVILGHTKCGAVTAVVKKAEVGGNIPGFTGNIAPAVEKIRAASSKLPEAEFVFKATKANVWQVIEDIFKASAEIREFVREGKLKVVGAMYDITTGEVTFMGVHYKQQELVGE